MAYSDSNYNNQPINSATAKFASSPSALNEQYFKEMENNSKLFEMKMKKLTRYSQEGLQEQSMPLLKPQRSNIDEGNRDEQLKTPNAKAIESLKNEIQYKDSLIDELRGKIELNEKNKASGVSMRDIPLYEREIDSLSNEVNKRMGEIAVVKEENENLKLKIENLKLENASIKQNKDHQINQTENLSIELSQAKDDVALLRKKLIEADKLNKNLKKEYEMTIQKLTETKKENASVKTELEEMKADNYNLLQENNEQRKKAGGKQYQPKKQQALQQHCMSSQPEFTPKRELDPQPTTATNYYTNVNQNRAVRSTYGVQLQNQPQLNEPPQSNTAEYSSYDNFGYFPSEKRIKENKNEMNSLDLQLNAWLKEKNMIENDLFRLPERPRTLNEIKSKKEKTDKLKEIDERINDIKTRIRQLNS